MFTYLSFVELILFSGTSLFFGYSFNEAYHTLECQVHSVDKLLLFSAFSVWHCFGIWVSFISKLCFWFFNEQRQLLVRLHPVTTTWQLTYFRSLKNDHVLIFLGGFFLSTKYGRGVCFSADTYMANREWGPDMPISPCNDREGGRERQPFLPLFCLLLSPAYSCLLPSSVDFQIY